MHFLDEDLYEAVKNRLPQIESYVASHGGTLELVGVKEGKVYIRLAGACHGCSLSTMTTKAVVERKLRELIHPELEVINVDTLPTSEIPEDLYRGETVLTEKMPPKKDRESFSKGIADKIAKLFGKEKS